ncbi:GH1 family beta-glucosidase [Deinococcus roseus]|uniref:Beta-glucosidase n=1 Tax=Deinococcus roseus TaxID=392414 RepID=A0ABQ2DGM5_9DEIO|nr:GH1 family beta-glucosidase [Deinococcus roseus]GGJ57093.1 beta-glucosidase [Deinococcus roseus]
MTLSREQFPADFRWGSATSSYQIEGAAFTDGKGKSIWDTFSHTPGNIKNAETGDVACDHYHLWEQDLDLMQDLGLNSYRFSISWPRVLPEGQGRINSKGLDFYDRLIDGLLQRNIDPFVTLYHWDLPQALQDQGGWVNRDTAHHFAEYADVVSQKLGDRVSHWITHNEPFCTSMLGHLFGVHAPGLRDQKFALQALHHVYLSHGLAVPLLRKNSKPDAQVGITLSLHPVYPFSDSPEDLAAVRRHDGFRNRWFLDPLYGKGYPWDTWALYGDQVPDVQEGDLQTIAAKMDFLGVNYYYREVVKHQTGAGVFEVEEVHLPDVKRTHFGWEVFPEGLTTLLERVHAEYRPEKLYITENGSTFQDEWVNGKVLDTDRQQFFAAHLQECLQVLQKGLPLKGYFAWSLLDNFEWAEGFDKRFGMVHVDFETQKRTLKHSGEWFMDFLRVGVVH